MTCGRRSEEGVTGPVIRTARSRLPDWRRARRRHPGQHRLHRYADAGGGGGSAGPVPGGRPGRRRRSGGDVGAAGPGCGRAHGCGQQGDRRAGPPAGLLRRGVPAGLVERPDPAAADPRRPRRRHRARPGPVRRGAERHHRLGRAATDPGGVADRPDAGAGQQGVPGGRWPAGHLGGEAGSDRRGRLRALRARAGAPRRNRRRGRPVDPDRQRRAVPRPYPGADARRHAGAGTGPPDLGHGPGHHHQQRHPGEQGAGAAGGPPAVRGRRWTASTSWCIHSRSCTPWSSSSTARRWRSAHRRT